MSLTLAAFSKLIAEFMQKDNERDGVQFVPGPSHSFRCIKCGKIHTFRYDAQHCKHERKEEECQT